MLAAAGAALTLVATYRGPGLSPDSVNYLAAGINLADGRGLRALDDGPLTTLAPALPVVTAVGERTIGSAPLAARLANVVSLVGIVVLVHEHLRRMVTSVRLRLVVTAIVAVSPVVLGVSKMAWTETAFIAVVLAFLLVLASAAARPPVRPTTLVVLAGIAATSFFIRYAGLVLVLCGAIVIAWTHRQRAGAALAKAAMFAGIASVPPALWMLRNREVDGTLLGTRPESPDSVPDVARRLVETLGGWVVPIEDLPRSVLLAVGTTAVVAIGVVATAASRSGARAGTRPTPPAAGGHRFASTHLTFVAVYVGYLAAAQLVATFDPVNARLLSPVYPSALLLGAVWVERLAPVLRRRAAARTGALVLAGVVVAGHAAIAGGYAAVGAVRGIGFNRTTWTESPLAAGVVDDIRERPAIVYSDRPPGLWAATGLQPLFQSPLRVGARGTGVDRSLEVFAADVRCAGDRVLLATYDAGLLTFDPSDLADVVEVEVVGEYPDGTLYALDAGESDPAGGC